jgi:hypothetical protein
MTDLSKFKVAKAFQHLDPNQGLAGGIAAGFSSIGYKGKFWTLKHGGTSYPFKRPDDGTPLSYIDCVVVGVSPNVSKTFFGEEAWTEDSTGGPICYATDGETPDPGVPDRQAQSCGICPRNEWITKPGGGRGKECQDHKRMAVLLMPAMTKKMLGAPLTEPVHLKIPPASLKSLKRYSDELQSEGIPFAAVVTRVSFTPGKQFEMAFETIEALGDKEADVVLPLMEHSQTRAILGTMPEVRQIAAPARGKPAEKVTSGLMEAFGAPSAPSNNGQAVPTRRGRPRAAPQTIENDEPQQTAKATEAAQHLESDTFEESDPDLDDTVNKLLGDKMNKMLK